MIKTHQINKFNIICCLISVTITGACYDFFFHSTLKNHKGFQWSGKVQRIKLKNGAVKWNKNSFEIYDFIKPFNLYLIYCVCNWVENRFNNKGVSNVNLLFSVILIIFNFNLNLFLFLVVHVVSGFSIMLVKIRKSTIQI